MEKKCTCRFAWSATWLSVTVVLYHAISYDIGIMILILFDGTIALHLVSLFLSSRLKKVTILFPCVPAPQPTRSCTCENVHDTNF